MTHEGQIILGFITTWVLFYMILTSIRLLVTSNKNRVRNTVVMCGSILGLIFILNVRG